MDINRWSTTKSDWLYSLQPKMEKLYTVSKNKTRSWLGLRSWTPYYKIQTYTEEAKVEWPPNGHYLNQTDYILCTQKWRGSIQSSKTKPGADCGSDHELLIPKFRIKLKKVGKTARPFRYDLHQIPYDYTVEVRNRFKGLDLIDRVPDEIWTEVCDIVQETGI